MLVASDKYKDPGLSRLTAPAHDAAALAEVLRDPTVGAFEVSIVHNRSSHAVRKAIEKFFARSSAEDLLVLHFSCHGVKNADGQLFLAMPDTRPDLLASTGVAASFVNEMMSQSPAQRIALFLDCCYGGAFPRGMVVKAGAQVEVRDSFADGVEDSDDRGHFVVTASNAMQYSFEAGVLKDHAEQPSVFTSALVDGLSSGEADRDGDGWVGLNELFAFAKKKVRATAAHQDPQMWTFGAQGDIRLARSRVRYVIATPLEPEFVEIMANPLSRARYGLVGMFRDRTVGTDLGVALTAWQALSSMVGDDDRRLADAARDALSVAALHFSPPVLELTTDDTGTATGVVVLDGPPLALAATARTETPWLEISQPDDRRVRLEATPPDEPGVHSAFLGLTTPIGQHEVPVRVTVPARDRPPGRLEQLWHSRALRYVAAGLAVLVLVVGAAVWLWPDGDDQSEALPRGTALPESAVLWVREEGAGSSMVVGTPDGEATTLLKSHDSLLWPVLLPDRQTIFYVIQDTPDPESGGEATLRVVGTDGNGDRLFDMAGSDCVTPGRPSVNANRLIALTCFDPEGRTPGIRILNEQGERVGPVVDRYGFVGNPTWAAQGRYLVYWRADDDTTSSPRHIYVTAADGTGERVALTTGSAQDIRPAVSPSGDQVVFQRKQGETSQLLVVEIDRDDPTSDPATPVVLERVDGAPRDPSWTREGQVMYTDEDGSAWVVDADPDAEPSLLMPDATDDNAYYLFGASR